MAYNLAYLYPEVVFKVVEDNIELLKHANMPKISDLLLPQSPAILRILTRLTVYKSPITIIPNFILNDFIFISIQHTQSSYKVIIKMVEPADQDKEGEIKITYPEIEPIPHILLLSPQFYEHELVNSVLWDDVAKLWDAPLLPNLVSDWKTWK
jgi:hypothetical protein